MSVCGSPSPIAVIKWANLKQREACYRTKGHPEPHFNDVWVWETGELGKDRSRVLPGMGIVIQPPSRAAIRQLVQERLTGLAERQKARAARRARNSEANRKSRAREERTQRMKCPVVFRASFQQPTNTAMKLPGPVEVEIYHFKIGPPAEWRARNPITRVDFRGITPQSTPGTLQKQIAYVHFEKQLTAWEAFDGRQLWAIEGDRFLKASQLPPRKLAANDWRVDKDGHVFLSESYLEKLKGEEAARKNTVTR